MNAEIFGWSRFGGYEVSSRGDATFSAFYATMPDGRSIEQHYQCDVKGYDIGGTNWRLGKGKPPLKPMTKDELWHAYLGLWRTWAASNPQKIEYLREKARLNCNVLSDRFASTPINQARALATILSGR